MIKLQIWPTCTSLSKYINILNTSTYFNCKFVFYSLRIYTYNNILHNHQKVTPFYLRCWEHMAFIYVWMPVHVNVCIISEINKKQQNNEGIFQEMTSWIHMHFTKASDVPLNDCNEYWGAVEQERENKIDSVFKKEEAFFLCSLMLSVWQKLSFVKVQCRAPLQQLHDNDEKKNLSSSNDRP